MGANPENLSSANRQHGGAHLPKDRLDKDAADDVHPDERGERARIDRRTGEVHGSGASAGGAGIVSEDYDDDSHGGGGAEPMGGPRPIEDAEHTGRDETEGYNH